LLVRREPMSSVKVPSRSHDANFAMPEDRAESNKPRLRVPIEIREHFGLSRNGEPVVVGVPLPRGTVAGHCDWRLHDARNGNCLPVQVEPLAFWPDGSMKWLSVMLLIDIMANEFVRLELSAYSCSMENLETQAATRRLAGAYGRAAGSEYSPPVPAACERPIATEDDRDACEITAGPITLRLPKRGTSIVESVSASGRDLLGDAGARLECLDARGKVREVVIESASIESAGEVCCEWSFHGRVRRCEGTRVTGKLSVYSACGLMRIELTLQNPARARHAGGCWDLGDSGSVLLKGWRLSLDLSVLEPQCMAWLESDFDQVHRTPKLPWRLCQFSSGGKNWNSRNHVNRHNAVPLRMRGYRCEAADSQREGLRARPVVCIEFHAGTVTCALTEFWERFPSAIRCESNRLLVEFWPDDFGDLHELQAGEHCTRVVWLRFDASGQVACRDLAWVHEPLLAQLDPAWHAATEVIPWLPDNRNPRPPELQRLLNEALTGPSGFFEKREMIDEYGWRNFGDAWADHEEAHYSGAKPIISHYNNQYDLLYGLLIQYLLTGDRRWWQLADPLARHVMDIDVYHTTRDKSAYSGGLFWHTGHYLDAATSSHRSYSRRMNGPSGGPANEHAYSAGLLLYYCLTGDRRATNTVLQLADWIIAMDEGAQHVLGLLSDAPTGRASCTAAIEYHGPGRGAGNAIGVLLDAWLCSGMDRYIDFSEMLIRRTIHPHDDIASRDLNNFEQRWSYTVYLQHLARYLHLSHGVDRSNGMREYTMASLVHYADWMLDNDLFYLDYPEQLEYPTETWAAQELRKGNVLFAASQYVDASRGAQFKDRAQSIMTRAWQTLMSFQTRCCTRPLALVLQQGYVESFFTVQPADRRHLVSQSIVTFGPRLSFQSQRDAVRAAVKSPISLLRMSAQALRPARWRNVLGRVWLVEQARRAFARLR
jgi:hypothetical protein